MKRIFAAIIVLAIGLGPAATGAVAEASTSTAPDSTFDRELAVFNLNSDGIVTKTTLLDSLTLFGRGRVQVSDFGATTGLRNLFGFEKPIGKRNVVNWNVEINGQKELLTAATTNAQGPLSIVPRYFLNGKRSTAQDILGESGLVAIEYRLINTTGKKENLEYIDSAGNKVTGSIETYVPLIGQVEFLLPAEKWSNLRATGGQVTTDERNIHHVTFSSVLAPIVGSVDQTIRVEGTVKRFDISETRVTFLPVVPAGVNARASSTSAATQKLFGGVGQVDSNLQKLHDGTLQLLDGLNKLYVGISVARAGVGAVGENTTITDGLSRVLIGLQQLGNTTAGLPSAKAGVNALMAGVQQVIASLGSSTTPGTLLNGLNKLDEGLTTLSATAGTTLATMGTGLTSAAGGLTAVNTGIASAQGAIGAAPAFGSAGAPGLATSASNDVQFMRQVYGCEGGTPDPVACPILGAIQPKLTAVNTGLGTAHAGIATIQPGVATAAAGAAALGAGITGAIGTPSTSPTTTLRGGIAALNAGVLQIKAGLSSGDANNPKILEGLSAVAAGLTKAISGIGVVGQGNTLTDGASRLLTGSKDLATGLEKIAAGTNTAASGAATIGTGQADLSQQGTQVIQGNVGASVQEASQAVAVLAAMERRAKTDAFLYGPPAGSSGSTTYVYKIAGVSKQAASIPWKFLIGAMMLAALIWIGTSSVRRGIATVTSLTPRPSLVPTT